jgi:hypothetical protein
MMFTDSSVWTTIAVRPLGNGMMNSRRLAGTAGHGQDE